MKANKLFLDVIAVFFRFIQFLGGQTIFNISSTQPFYYKEVVELITFDHFSSRASTADKTCSHRPPFQNQFPDQRVKGVMRTSGGIDFRFRLNLKITLVESTYPSQRPQCPSLSPHFLLHGYTLHRKFTRFEIFLVYLSTISSQNKLPQLYNAIPFL